MAETAEERKERLRMQLVKGRQTAALRRQRAAVADPPAEVQCEYCSLYFQAAVLPVHQGKVHKGEIPVEVALPAGAASLSPGSILRIGVGPDQRGIPSKVPWTRQWVEQGWECLNPDCKDPAKPGWRKIPKGDEIPSCSVCHQPMRKMFDMVDWDVPDQCPSYVNYGGVEYRLAPGQVNRIPSIIRDIARQSMDATKHMAEPKQDGDPVGWARLGTVGLMPSLEEEAEAERAALAR